VRCAKMYMMNNKLKLQILQIRKSGLTNMFDTIIVQRIANEMHFYDLVVFIEEHRKEYIQFILTGKMD